MSGLDDLFTEKPPQRGLDVLFSQPAPPAPGQAGLNLNLARHQNLTPEQEARHSLLAQKSGLPLPVVRAHEKEVETLLMQRALTNNPVLQRPAGESVSKATGLIPQLEELAGISKAPKEGAGQPVKRQIGATGSFAPETPLEETAGRLGAAVAGTAREFGLGISLGYSDLYDIFPGLEQFEQKYQQNIPINPDDPLLFKIEKHIRNDPAILAKMPAHFLGAILSIGKISRAVSAIKGIPVGTIAKMIQAAQVGGIVGGVRKPAVEDQLSLEALGERVKNAAFDAAFFAVTTGLVSEADKAIQHFKLGKFRKFEEFRENMYKHFIDERGFTRNGDTIGQVNDVLANMVEAKGGWAKVKGSDIKKSMAAIKKATEALRAKATPAPPGAISPAQSPAPGVPAPQVAPAVPPAARFGPEAFNREMFRKLALSEGENELIGNLGDFIKDKNLRKILKDALHIQINSNSNQPRGGLARVEIIKLSPEQKKAGVPPARIELHPIADEAALIHEAGHALRAIKGRDFSKEEKDVFEASAQRLQKLVRPEIAPGFTPAGEALRRSIPTEPDQVAKLTPPAVEAPKKGAGVVPQDEVGVKPPPPPETTPQAKKHLTPVETRDKYPFLPGMRELTLEMKAAEKFPGVERSFLKQPKVKTDILQYFTPAEYHLKELGFDVKIGQPVREALQDFSIELMGKNDLVINAQANHYDTLKRRNLNWRKLTKKKPMTKEQSNDLVFQMVDKGIPEKGQSIEARIARIYRPETEEMLTRMNKVRALIGKPPIVGLKNYILHALKPEVLNEIYSKGVIPPELAKVMQHIPNKNLFLRTAQQRKGVPEEWLIKDPHQLMKMMYAIDLRYIHLQKALHKIEPYMKAVKDFAEPTPEGGVDEWSPETYKYLDDWIKQAIKMRPSNLDTLFDNLLEATLAPILRRGGIRVSHMPWRDAVNFLSASVHTGALGLRAKPVLRNLVQSSFDWVMYGTKAYAKGSGAFMTPEGHKILKKSKVWRTRMPFEAQDLATLQKVFKTGSLGYRAADLHNVGKGILTRYYHAIDNLGKSPAEAIKWADLDVPGTQWSYRREDLPRAYWTTTGRAVWTLGSWWMNFYTRFLPEILNKTFKGVDVTGRVVPLVERMAGIRFLALVALLYGVKEQSKELIGTTIDYTGSVQPAPLGGSPIMAFGQSAVKMIAGLAGKHVWLFKQGLEELKHTSKIFVPYWLAAEEYYDYWTGKKTGGKLLFYGSDKSLTLEDVLAEFPFTEPPKSKQKKQVSVFK